MGRRAVWAGQMGVCPRAGNGCASPRERSHERGRGDWGSAGCNWAGAGASGLGGHEHAGCWGSRWRCTLMCAAMLAARAEEGRAVRQ